MKLFKVQTCIKYKKPFVSHWKVITNIPPIATFISTGFYLYSESTGPLAATVYIIDLDYTPPVIDPKDPFFIYKSLLITRLTNENFL